MTSASTTPREKTTTIRGLVGRIMVLSLTLVAAIYLVPLLIAYRMWLWLGIVVLTTGAMFLLYSTRRFVPAKYLFPGTFFLTVFLIVGVGERVGAVHELGVGGETEAGRGGAGRGHLEGLGQQLLGGLGLVVAGFGGGLVGGVSHRCPLRVQGCARRE